MSPVGGGEINKVMLNGLWRDNPVFRQVLGICSTLAITNMVLNTLVMCVALVFVMGASCFTVSVLRSYTPRNIRMMVETLIIAFYVILVNITLQGYWPEMSTELGPYVGLIITNCIIMGRTEAYSMSNPPIPSFFDGVFNGIGYSFVLLAVAFFRELLGQGTLLGLPVPYFYTDFDKWVIMVMPPGAFFMLGVVVWFLRDIRPPKAEAKK